MTAGVLERPSGSAVVLRMRYQTERRRYPRRVVDRPAKIILTDGIERCRILDISGQGARLRTSASSWLPDNFELDDVFSGVRRSVARVWSKHHDVGVRFLT